MPGDSDSRFEEPEKKAAVRPGEDVFLSQLPVLNCPPEGLIEQHCHVGGAVPMHRLFEMAVERGIRLPVSDYHEFSNLLHRRRENSGSLEKYLEVYEVAERIQSGPQALRESVLIALNGAARTGGAQEVAYEGEAITPPKQQLPIRGLELRFNPMKRNGGGLYDLDRVMLAACSAIEEVKTAYKGQMRAGLIVCLGRDTPWEQNFKLADKVSLWASQGLPVVGIDLAGPESSMPLSNPADLEKMAEAYKRAGPLVGRTVHCGETRSIDVNTFIATMRDLKPHRVGHPLAAVRAYLEDKDDRGLRFMADAGISAEFCVVSNLLTGAVDKVEDYRTILSLLDKYGIPYAFSTDAPALQRTTLASELKLLQAKGAATAQQLERSFAVSASTSFLNLKLLSAPPKLTSL